MTDMELEETHWLNWVLIEPGLGFEDIYEGMIMKFDNDPTDIFSRLTQDQPTILELVDFAKEHGLAYRVVNAYSEDYLRKCQISEENIALIAACPIKMLQVEFSLEYATEARMLFW